MNTMSRATSFAAMARAPGPLFLAAGFFDGVHRGHQQVMKTACRQARAAAGSFWVLTFETHPLKTLAPGRAPALLTSPAHKARLLERLGADGCLSLPFNRTWAAMEPLAFLDRLLREAPDWRAIFIGRNWRFGRRAAGNTACLRRWAAQHGIDVTTVPPLRCDGQPVSSTRIRAAIKGGRLAAAGRMLGRPFSLFGVVRRGRGMGRKLGYPTANVIPDNEVRPPCGVYAAAVGFDDGSIAAAVLNLGTRPTFAAAATDGARPVLEVHLLDGGRDLYGCTVEVFLLEYLRKERCFPDIETLRRQIAADSSAARRVMAKKCHLRALQKARHDIHCATH